MLLPILGLVAGLAVLTVAADLFVAGAAAIARRLRLSAVVVGAVVIGFGTSAPTWPDSCSWVRSSSP